ncbi:MAG: hypothetical protein ACRDSL_18080 [Pseudonocardiaceae bacterium]
MTPVTGLRLLADEDLLATLEDHLVPPLTTVLHRRTSGHCMRVDDIEIPLAVRLCRRLRSATRGQVCVLGVPPAIPDDLATSSTKIVELRNPDADGQLRPPLLVFVPPGTRASAEDSFGVATFEQIMLGRVYDELATRLLRELPPGSGRAAGICSRCSTWSGGPSPTLVPGAAICSPSCSTITTGKRLAARSSSSG